MYHDIPDIIKARMNYIESLDAEDPLNGTPRMETLRQIPPEIGKFSYLLAATAPEGDFLEIDTNGIFSIMDIISVSN